MGGDGTNDADRRPWLAPALLVATMAAWLWPIGVGGRMPVGGDVTSFSIGLMAVLGRSIKAGRLPLWNDLWGFGFPGLAESQMGVYYPPHLALYGLLSTEAAYTASLVLHSYWAAFGAYWASRRFGVSRWGAALAGFSWAASGMFVIHLPHQWGYTTGSWLPWIVGLAWPILRGEARGGSALMLAAALALQVLPGHFQFAFETQVTLLILATWGLIDGKGRRQVAIRGGALILGAIVAVGPLAAMQVWPTLQLARSTTSQRTFDYLSAFPASPVHLVNYVAPNLFHLSPLWRPLAWDPFHAMPEEHRPYIGLVPLMLAIGAIRRGLRADPATRALTVVAVVSLLLSLGPYVPGFSLLIRLPGFSYFRAPARWGLVTELALAILAGRGFDDWRSWPHFGRGVARFSAVAAVVIGLVVGSVEMAFASTNGPGDSAIARGFEGLQRLVPWSGDASFRSIMAAARRGPSDPLILGSLIREGIEPRRAATARLDQERAAIYPRELGETVGLLVLLAAIAPLLARRDRRMSAVLLGLTILDLLLLSRHRAVETAPIRPLVEQSAVLGRLAAMPPGSRTIDPFRNLPMVAGVAPVSAYRTLDRPAMQGLTAIAAAPRDGSVDPGRIVAAMRALGASVRVLDPFEPGDGEVVVDAAMAAWLYGDWGRRTPEAARFRLWSPVPSPARAWFVPGEVRETLEPGRIVELFDRAIPLELRSSSPEEFLVEGSIPVQPGTVIVSVLDDPGWRVSVTTKDGESYVPVRPIFRTPGGGAWQAISTGGEMGSGSRWVLRYRWTYRDPAALVGGAIALFAWLIWIALMIGMTRRSRPVATGPGPSD